MGSIVRLIYQLLFRGELEMKQKNTIMLNEYYGELCTQIYEKSKSIADGKELEFFLYFVQDKKMKVLEPMCGNGRMLIPFMEKGIDIRGI